MKTIYIFLIFVFSLVVFASAGRSVFAADSTGVAEKQSDDGDADKDKDTDTEKPKKKHHKHHDRDDSYKIPYEDLTQEEKEVLARGEISNTSYVVGGILGTWPGFGIGHAVQGRYSEKGWIFTVGEAVSLTVLLVGAAEESINNCSTYYGTCSNGGNNAALVAGLIGYIGFRVWEIVDVWATPPELNNRYRDLRNRVDDGREARLSLYLVTVQKDISGLGLQLRF